MKEKIQFYSLLILLIINSNISDAQGVWMQKADLGSKYRSSASSFNIANKGYICAGFTHDTVTLTSYAYKDLLEYDPSTNIWVNKADFPGSPRYGAIGFSIGNKGYFGLGVSITGVFYKDFWEFNPDSNKWTQKLNFPGLPRAYSIGFSIGTKGYVGTGANGNGKYKDFWEFNPDSNVWTQKADFGGGVKSGSVGFSIGMKGYIGAGSNNIGDTKDFWEFNVDSNKWTKKVDIGNFTGSSCVAFVIDNIGYVCLGAYGISTNDFIAYDPSVNTWIKKSDFPNNSRYGMVAFSIDNKGYIGTGVDTNYLNLYNDLWEYTPMSTGIPKTDKIVSFSIYPDPSQGSFRINSFKPIDSYEIFDSKGILLTNNICEINKNIIDIRSELPDGFYYIKVISGARTSIQKFIINKF